MTQYWRELFFTKDLDWATEHEYRWVLLNEDPAPIFVDISDCVRMIVLGDGFSSNRLPSVRYLTRNMGGVVIAQIRYMTGRPQSLPILEPPVAAERPRRRSGDLAVRAAALAAAEAEAAANRRRGEEVAASALTVLSDLVERCAARLTRLDDVRVALHSSGYAAVPLSERQRAPGVARGDVMYSGGLQCVVENQPQHSFTLVCAVGVQVLIQDRMRFYGVFESERWLADGNDRRELWRGSRATPTEAGAAQKAAVDLAEDMEHRLDDVIEAYNALREANHKSEP